MRVEILLCNEAIHALLVGVVVRHKGSPACSRLRTDNANYRSFARTNYLRFLLFSEFDKQITVHSVGDFANIECVNLFIDYPGSFNLCSR